MVREPKCAGSCPVTPRIGKNCQIGSSSTSNPMRIFSPFYVWFSAIFGTNVGKEDPIRQEYYKASKEAY